MTELFTITAATSRVKLDAMRQAEVAFTVTNAEERPIRGRALVRPEGGAPAEWFTLDGEAEQIFPVAGTQQYLTKIAIPLNAPAGDYFFRLNMVGVENPDEDFTEGPSVAFTVPKPEGRKMPFPWWILLVILAIVVIGSVAAFFLSGAGAGLAVAVDVSADPVVAGRNLTYTISLSNNDRQAATGVIITDNLPAGTTFVSTSSSNCQINTINQILICQLTEPIAGNAATEVEIIVFVDGAARDSLVNTVSVQAEGLAEPIQKQTTSDVVGQVSLSANINGPSSVQAIGQISLQQIPYQITVSNNGPSHARDVIVTYPNSPAILKAVGASNRGECVPVNDTLQCELGVIEAGSAVLVNITVIPGPVVVGGTLTTQITVKDSDGSNISVQTQTAIECQGFFCGQ